MTMIFDGDTRSFFILQQELKVEIAVPEHLLKLAEKSQQVMFQYLLVYSAVT
jgi:hypothetical protein